MLLKNEPEKVIQEIFHRFCGKGVEILTQRAHNIIKFDDLVKSQQNDGFDVGASCGRPCPGERSSPPSRVSRDKARII
jgi:hypothetical protein